MKPDDCIWVFIGETARTPGGLFREISDAEDWILKHELSGSLTALPVDAGVFDWSLENDVLGLKPDKVSKKSKDPLFVAACFPASLDHYHYEAGSRAQEKM